MQKNHFPSIFTSFFLFFFSFSFDRLFDTAWKYYRKIKTLHKINELIQNSRSENSITVIDYWLKLVTVIRVAGWPKSPTCSDNRVAG
jgi:hypothetical protein